jgi:hypothetical protein
MQVLQFLPGALSHCIFESNNFDVLLQLRVFRFRLLQYGDVGIGVFPKREKIFISGERSDAGGISIRTLQGSGLQAVGPSHSQMGQRSRPAVLDDAAVVENLLKLRGGSRALPSSEIRLAANEMRDGLADHLSRILRLRKGPVNECPGVGWHLLAAPNHIGD